MEHTLEIIGTVVGILYLWLEYRASIYLWIAGIIMPAVYIFVTRIYIVSLRKVGCLCRLPDAQIVVNLL